MRSPILLLALMAALWAACSTSHGPPEPAKDSGSQEDAARFYDHAWARDPIWDDGQAEVALYDARRPQYGQLESYQAVFIVVKGDFRRPFYVKADPPLEGKALFPVLKLNAVHSYLTPRYPYHFLVTVFVQRDNPTALVKLTLGSQEWCGNTFKEITTWGPQPQLVAHSYFDGEGDGTHPLDLRPGDLLEDQLPLALRSLDFQPHLSFEPEFPICPSPSTKNAHQAALSTQPEPNFLGGWALRGGSSKRVGKPVPSWLIEEEDFGVYLSSRVQDVLGMNLVVGSGPLDQRRDDRRIARRVIRADGHAGFEPPERLGGPLNREAFGTLDIHFDEIHPIEFEVRDDVIQRQHGKAFNLVRVWQFQHERVFPGISI